jgi:hypothetical protein
MKSQRANIILKKNKVGRLSTSLFQNLLQSYNNQNNVVLAKGNTEQWDKSESPEISPSICGQFNFSKDIKTICSVGKDSFFQQVVPGKLGIHM